MSEQSSYFPLKVDYNEWINRAGVLLNRAKGGKRMKTKGSSSEKYQYSLKRFYFHDKADRFIQAAEAFRICGKFLDASDAYSRAASIFEHQLVGHNQAAMLYTEAGLCLEKIEVSQGSDAFGTFPYIYTLYIYALIIYDIYKGESQTVKLYCASKEKLPRYTVRLNNLVTQVEFDDGRQNIMKNVETFIAQLRNIVPHQNFTW